MRILLLFSLVVLSTSLSAQTTNKIDSEILAELQAGATVEVIVAFAEQADLSLAYRLKGKAAKGRFVYEQTQKVATRSQRQVRDLLTNQETPFRSYAIVNALFTEVDLPTALAIAARPEVANLQPNPWAMFDRPMQDNTPQGGARVVEWGIERINADDVWSLGYQGADVVVGGQDTGYEWWHPTIKEQYRGWDGIDSSHHYNWHDAIREISLLHNDSIISPDNNPCGLDVDYPCDDHNHGTHTMGTMVGDDGQGNQIGVAPLATWIGCRNMERGWGSPASYIECFDWFLAPTDLEGENADPTAAPHVIANSWGCPPVEGCNPDNFALMETAVEALRAAGVVVVVSAGNNGPNCHTVSNPAAIFEGSFSIGASRQNDTIANFSSRGTVLADSSMRLKPNVVAPGVGVRSAIREGSFATWNGTSMAGPHVAGAVALIISANPALAGEVELIENILETTAVPLAAEQDCDPFLGESIPNPTYGYGRIDVLAAVEMALTISDTEEQYLPFGEVFPNPTNDVLWVNTSTDALLSWDVFALDGRLLLSGTQAGGLISIDLSALPAGAYTYRLHSAEGEQSGRVIKQ